MRPRIPPAPATYDYQDQQELRRVLSDFINVNTDVQADPNEIAAPRFSAIKQSAGATPATQTDVVLTIENGGGWGGTLTVWTNRTSPNDADATLAADGTFAVPSCPAAIGPTTLFNLTGGGTGNLLNDVGVHPGRGKRIYALFEDVNGSSTGIWSFVLTSQSGPVDATNTILPATVGTSQLVDASVINAKIADAAVNTAKFAAGIRPVRIVSALPGAGDVQGDTVFLTTDNKLYRWTGTAWTAAVPTVDLTGTISTTQLADGSVTTVKIGDSQVTTIKIGDSQVTTAKIGASQVTTTTIADSAITTAKIGASQVTTATIADGSIITAKIGASQVTTTTIADSAVTTLKIGDTQVTTAKLVDGSVVAAKIADANIDLRKLASALVNGVSFVDARNKLYNPSFEDAGAYWSTGAGISFVTNSVNAKTGNKYAEITAAVSTDIHQDDDTALNARYFEVRPGDVIKFGCWAQRVSGDGAAFVTLVSVDKDKLNAVGHASSQATTAVWTLLTGEYTVGATDKYVRFKCTGGSMTVSSTYRFDDCFLIVETPGGDIIARSITADRIVAAAITANEIAALTIQAGNIAAHQISVDKLFIGSFDNLIPDPGFEQNDLANYANESTGTVVINSVNPRSGARCVSITPAAATSGALVAGGLSSTQSLHFAASEGESYYFEAWMRKDTIATVAFTDVKIQFRNSAGTSIQDTGPGGFQPSQVYTKRSWTAVAPAGTAWVVFYIGFNAGNTNAILVDDMYARRMLTGSLVVDGSISAQQITAATITTAQIAAGTIVAANIAANTITAGQIAANTITAGQIAANTITAAQIAANTITASQIAANTITAAQIAANTITAAQIATDTITAGQIAAGAVSTSELAARSVSLEKLFVGSHDNLCMDPGFEQVTALGSADGWSTVGYTANGGTLSLVSTNVRSGVQCVQFNPSGQTATTSFGANGSNGVSTKHVAATEADQYYFEFWTRKVGAGTPPTVTAVLRFMNAANGTISTVNGTAVNPTTTYGKAFVSGAAPAGTAYVVFQINFNLVGGATELVNIDDAYARRMATGEIVVDGTITAVKLAVTQLSAITADMGTLTAGLARDVSSKFVVDFTNALITVTDNQAGPVVRAKFGKVNTGTTDYGIQVWDASGNAIMDFTGAKRILAVPLQDQGLLNTNITLDLSTGLTQIVQLGASALTLTFTGMVNGGRYRVWFQQDTTGSRTFPTITNAVMYTNGTAPVLTTTPGALDLFEFEYRSSPTARFTCITLQANVLLPTPNIVSTTVSSLPVSTGHTVSMPASVTTGDLLLMLCCFSGSSSRTTPTGWSLVGNSGLCGIFAKVSDGTEGGTTVNVVTVGSEVCAAQVLRINKWFGALTGVSSSMTTGAAAAAGDPPSKTPGWTDRTLWLAVASIGALNTITDPTNYGTPQTTDSSTTARLHSVQRVLYATTEDPSTFSWVGSTSWGVATLAIRPPA